MLIGRYRSRDCKDFGWLDAIHPQDRERVDAAWREAVAGKSGIGIEYRVRHHSGNWRWITARGTPVFDPDGSVREYVGMNTDIEERKQAEEKQAVLVREMNHRVKNLLAVAGSLVSLSARTARSPADMAEAVGSRLNALMRAHELIRPSLIDNGGVGGKRTLLADLITAIVSSYIDPSRQEARKPVVIEGPDIAIGGSAATTFALVLHELATNAAKYGALSSLAGSVAINWSNGGNRMVLNWAERGGLEVASPPENDGFGSWLARTSIAGLGGHITYDWQRDGLAVRLALPLDRLAA